MTKTIIYSILAVSALLLIGYNSLKYWEQIEKQATLTAEQNARLIVIDSLYRSSLADSVRIANLITEREAQKEIRTGYKSNYETRKQEISKTSYSEDKQFNDKFILEFKPKW